MSDPTEPSEPTSDPQSIEDELDAALAALDARLAAWGFSLLDGQLPHEGLVGYGFQSVPRPLFLMELTLALKAGDRRGDWSER